MPDDLEAAKGAQRDRFQLTRTELLRDHTAIHIKRPGAAVATALRTRSSQYLDLLAFAGTDGRMEWPALRTALSSAVDDVMDCEPINLDPATAVEIGKVVLLQPYLAPVAREGARVLELGLMSLPANEDTRAERALLVRHLVLSGASLRAYSLLDEWPDVDEHYFGYLRTQLASPWSGKGGDADAWQSGLSRPFVAQGLRPLSISTAPISEGAATAFDALLNGELQSHLGPSALGADQVVSVVMTVRDCASAELRTSVLSLLGQSHEVAELVVVDDSEGTASALFEGLTDSMKPNVKIVQLEGRQTDRLHAILSGVKQCSSDFIALQRCGDWSHPDRLKLQMSHLALHPELSGCFAASIACSSNFDWVSLTDDSPQRADLETLVFRRRSLTEDHLWWGVLGEGNVGGDTGFDELGVPVAFARHADEALRIQEADSPGFSVVLTERSLPPLDVVLAGDWSRSGGPQSSMLAELDALAARGLRTGVLHMEAARFMSTVPPELNTDIEVLIGNGETQRVHLEDSRDVRLLVLRYPPILQFAPDEPSRLAVEKMCILANQAPSELDGGDVRYLVRDCHANAQRVFTPHVIWAPQGPAVRQAIAPYLRADEISAFNLPGVIRQEKWSTRRNHRRSVVPIVGRHSRDNAMKWPDSADVLRQVYPLDGSMDVRVMGGCRAALRVLGLSTVPAAWTCWPADAMPVHSFLQSLDYYVFFPHPKAVEAFGRAILEAIASGLVVFLPPHFEAVFGPGAVYCEPGDVASFVRKFHEDSEMYAEQSRAAELMAQQEFSLAAHADRVLQMLDRARV